MTCNETVEFLLRDGAPAVLELEAHLSSCQRCRSLQEVLSPLRSAPQSSAVDLSAPFSPATLCSAGALHLAQDSALRLKHSALDAKQLPARSIARLKYLAAFLAGVAASLGGIAALQSEPIQPARTSGAFCLWDTEFHKQSSKSEFVQSCVACHLVSQR